MGVIFLDQSEGLRGLRSHMMRLQTRSHTKPKFLATFYSINTKRKKVYNETYLLQVIECLTFALLSLIKTHEPTSPFDYLPLNHSADTSNNPLK
jgi:Na+-transporting NADH:ubiquinone oxidoreductase subunit NqrF